MSWLDSTAPETQNRERRSFDLIPNGWRPFVIEDVSDLTKTNAGTGHYVQVQFKSTDPAHPGSIWETFNVDNPNAKAVTIAQDNLLDIGDAVGVPVKIAGYQDTPNWLRTCVGQVLEVKVGLKKSEEYGDKNTAKGFRKAKDARAPDAPAAASPGGWR